MCILLSNDHLRELTEIYHVQDGTKIPVLIEFLWSLRHLQDKLEDLPPMENKTHLVDRAQEMDCAIASEIIESVEKCLQSIPP